MPPASRLTCASLGGLLLHHSAKQVARSQLVIYAPFDAQVIVYPVFLGKRASAREQTVLVLIDKGNAATGVADMALTCSTRSRRPPPSALLFQKQEKIPSSSATVWEYPSSANDVSCSTPRKTVRFAQDEPRVPRKSHRQVQAHGI